MTRKKPHRFAKEAKIRKITHQMNTYLKHGYALTVCKRGCRLHKKKGKK